MAKTYETDGQGDEALVVLHYFMGGSDWYIVERDKEEEQNSGSRVCSIEWRYTKRRALVYIPIGEITELGAELDIHWSPKTSQDSQISFVPTESSGITKMTKKSISQNRERPRRNCWRNPLKSRISKGVVYVYGSELATLRLLLQYRKQHSSKSRIQPKTTILIISHLNLALKVKTIPAGQKIQLDRRAKIQSEKYNKDLHAVDARLEQESKVRNNKYLVTWEIDSEERSPVAAANDAFEVMKHPESLGGCF